MRPDEYFPSHYRDDLRLFSAIDVPRHGPFGILCGMTLGRLFEPGQPEKYADPEGFLCMLWLLNLAHQGIYTYFPSDYQRWLTVCEPFPDLRGCSSCHGGVCTPDALLRFARDPSYITLARPFELHDVKVREFFQFFFTKYLGVIVQDDGAAVNGFSAPELLERLCSDLASPEVSRYARG